MQRMKFLFRYFLIPFSIFSIDLGFFWLPASILAQPAVAYSWDFETPGDSEGWIPANGLSGFVVTDGLLKTTIIDSDPYMFGPKRLSIETSRYSTIIVRMRLEYGEKAEFFWTTADQPDFKAGFEMAFAVKADGAFHEYEVPVMKSKHWTGTVTRLRLDPGEGSAEAVANHGQVEIDYIRVVHLGPRLKKASFSVNRAVIAPGDTFGLVLNLKNTGDEAFTGLVAELRLFGGLSLVNEKGSVSLPAIAPDSTYLQTWKITAQDTGLFAVQTAVLQDGIEILSDSLQVTVQETLPTFPPEIPSRLRVWSPSGELVLLENSSLRVAFVKREMGFGPVILFAAQKGRWKQIAVLQPPGSFSYQSKAGNVQTIKIFPWIYLSNLGRDSAEVSLFGQTTDVDSVIWRSSLVFRLSGEHSSELSVEATLTPSAECSLLNFTGLAFRVGEGSFGSKKEAALFPGLEWLVGDEKSSSDLDVHEPYNRRYLPHPYKVTIPVMSVSNEGLTVALSWDPNQSWYPGQRTPSPIFASPNTWDGQANHLLGLVIPPVGGLRDENAALAKTPFTVEAGQTVRLKAKLFVLLDEEEMSGVIRWFQIHGLPQLPAKPWSYSEDVRLSTETFMEHLWDSRELGWHMVLKDPWGPMSDHTVATQVWLGANYLDNPLKAKLYRAQMVRMVNKLIETDHNPAAVGLDLAIRVGELDRVWTPVKNWAMSHCDGQLENGGWHYTGDSSLKNAGETSLGTCVYRANVLLRAARISGDKFLYKCGLKALDFMSGFRVPRGAQTWEIPLHAPDILAAALAVRAFVEGYRLTQKQKYLNEAVRWATAALPFVYLWHTNERPIMAYGSIPVFGATFYTGAWFGNIVQWNGLDLAYALLQLWPYDQSRPWKKLAEGLTICGMQLQQYTGAHFPEDNGMYPDAFNTVTGQEAYHWDLAPKKILQNLLALSGSDPDVQTQILPFGEDTLHVNSGVSFTASISGNRLYLAPKLSFPDSVQFLIPSVRMPQTVTLNGVSLPEVGDVDSVDAGWAYALEGNLIVKFFAPDSSQAVEISGLSFLPEIKLPQWDFNIEGWLQGWYPNFDVTNVSVKNGVLRGLSTGGDPWFTGPQIEIQAKKFDSLEVSFSVSSGTMAQIFWKTKQEPYFSESKSIQFQIFADSHVHTYPVALCSNPNWKGLVTQIRFDPTTVSEAKIAIDAIRLIPASGADVERKNDAIPLSFQVWPNYPNPFCKSTQIRYRLPGQGQVSLTIFNVLGERLAEFKRREINNLTGKFVWNGKDNAGRQVPPGIYFYRLRFESHRKNCIQTRKMLVLPERMERR